MLYIISTPIGNLGDITFRAVDTLKNCTTIYCEDTRQSHILMERYGITAQLISYHKFNEEKMAEKMKDQVARGESIALISDAGTPLISDPGSRLIDLFIKEKLPFTALPGPTALIDALVLSGLLPIPFQFIGFLPKGTGELVKALSFALNYEGTTVCYESPHRIRETLSHLNKADPLRPLAIARELTKKFEEVLRGSAEEILNALHEEPKGEFVLLISGRKEEGSFTLSPKEHVAFLIESFGIDEKSALRLAAELRGMQKRELYRHIKNF